MSMTTITKVSDNISSSFGFLQIVHSFHQAGSKILDKNHVYVDSCSTFHQLANANLVQDIKTTKDGLTGHCNAGTTNTNKTGKFGSLDIWVNTEGIANILSLDKLEEPLI